MDKLMNEFDADSQADRDAENKSDNAAQADLDEYKASFMLGILGYLRNKKADYEKEGLIPTLELLIEDIEKEYAIK